MSALNGLTVVTPTKTADMNGWGPNDEGAELAADKSIIKRSKISLANIFFKVRLVMCNLLCRYDILVKVILRKF